MLRRCSSITDTTIHESEVETYDAYEAQIKKDGMNVPPTPRSLCKERESSCLGIIIFINYD